MPDYSSTQTDTVPTLPSYKEDFYDKPIMFSTLTTNLPVDFYTRIDTLPVNFYLNHHSDWEKDIVPFQNLIFNRTQFYCYYFGKLTVPSLPTYIESAAVI